MKHGIKAFYFLLALSVSVFVISVSYAGQMEALSNIAWEQKFGDIDYSYHNRSAAFSPKDSGLFIAGTFIPSAKGRPPIPEGLWVWKINSKGEKVKDLTLKNPEGDESRKYVDVKAMAITGDEDIILIVQMQGARINWFKLNSAGEILITKELGPGRDISRIVPTADKSFLLIGHEKFAPLVIKLDTNGEVLWEKVGDRGKDAMFVDGIATEDNGFVLVENSGKRAQFFFASSEIWVTKYDSKGQKILEKSFPGHHGSIARLRGEKYAVVYDKSETAKQDIWVKALDKDFNEKWNTNVTSTDFGLEKFKIAGLSNGNYIVAGPVMLRPWVSYIDAAGIKKWDFHNKTFEPASGTDFIATGNDCFIISSIVASTDQYKINNKIKVLKFLP